MSAEEALRASLRPMLGPIKHLALVTEAALVTAKHLELVTEAPEPGQTVEDLAGAFASAYNAAMVDVALHREAVATLTAVGLRLADEFGEPFAKVVQLPSLDPRPSTHPWQGPKP